MLRFTECFKLFIKIFFTAGIIFISTLQFMAEGASFLLSFCLAMALDAIIFPIVCAVVTKIP